MAKTKPPTMRLDGEITSSGLGGGATAASGARPAPGDNIKAGRRRAWATAFLCYVIVVVLLGSGYYLRPYPTQVGRRPVNDVQTPVRLSVIDQEATDAALEAIPAASPLIWVVDQEAVSRALQKRNSFIGMMEEGTEARNNEQLGELARQVRDQLNIALDPATVRQFLPERLATMNLTPEMVKTDLELVIKHLLIDKQIVGSIGTYGPHVKDGNVELVDKNGVQQPKIPDPDDVLQWREAELRDYLLGQVLESYLPGADRSELRQAVAELTVQVIGGPNVTFDEGQTLAEQSRRRQELLDHPKMQVFAAGSTIVKAGESIGLVQAEALRQLNERRRGTILVKLLGIMLISAVMMGTVALYLVRFRSDFRDDATSVLLHALPVMLALGIAQTEQYLLGDKTLVMLSFPAALVGLLASLVINPRAGFVLVLVASLLFGIVNEHDLEFLSMALFGGFATVLTSRRLRERADMIQVAWKVGLVNVAVVVMFSLIEGSLRPNPVYMVIAFVNAPISVGATLFVIRFFERVFGIVTDLRLLELTGLRHPLITHLEEKAPGSYQHVLNVTKLAEAAANAIGANYLLVRAGALFHDVGKMVKPKYYSENQVTIEDKKAHGKLSPYMSVLIIKNHVKEGIELGRRCGLPQKIIDFIPQHHGTGLIRYFYSAAMRRYEETPSPTPVNEEDFRYPGPKPQTREAAIVLLADSVEAVAASKFTGGQVSEDELRRVTQMAISERFNDGQFDECDLTMNNLRDMREAFVRTLMARYHFRISYPSLPKPSQSTAA